MIQQVSNYDLLSIPVREGQIYYATDIRALFQDFGPSIKDRRRLSAFVLNTDYERLNRIRPQNGLNYYVIETNFLWTYDTKWVLKDGDIRQYNSYTYSSAGISPVVSTDNLITSVETGDRIIDNNGLLGNGAVVIRDSNRLNKGVIGVDAARNGLSITSYLDNGISFYPYGFTSDQQEKLQTGSFHLGVEANEEGTGIFSSLSHRGVATYYGDFNLYGDAYTLEIKPFEDYTVSYIPVSPNEFLTFQFECSKTILEESTDRSYTQYRKVIIYEITETTCKIRITTYNNRSGATVTDANGNIIYDGALTIESDIIYDGNRTSAESGVAFCITSNSDEFILSGPVLSPLVTFTNWGEYTNEGDTVYAQSQLLHKIKISEYSGKVNIFRLDA